MPDLKKIAVFASGSGSNFISIHKQICDGNINGIIKLLISNNPKAKAIEFAKNNNIDYYVVEPQKRKIIKKSYADNFLKDS